MLQERIELSTSPLPRECSTTELLQRRMVREWAFRGHRLGLQEQSCGKCVRAVAVDRPRPCAARQSCGCRAWEFMGEIRRAALPLPNRAAVMRSDLPYFGACLGIPCNAFGAIWESAGNCPAGRANLDMVWWRYCGPNSGELSTNLSTTY